MGTYHFTVFPQNLITNEICSYPKQFRTIPECYKLHVYTSCNKILYLGKRGKSQLLNTDAANLRTRSWLTQDLPKINAIIIMLIIKDCREIT